MGKKKEDKNLAFEGRSGSVDYLGRRIVVLDRGFYHSPVLNTKYGFDFNELRKALGWLKQCVSSDTYRTEITGIAMKDYGLVATNGFAINLLVLSEDSIIRKTIPFGVYNVAISNSKMVVLLEVEQHSEELPYPDIMSVFSGFRPKDRPLKSEKPLTEAMAQVLVNPSILRNTLAPNLFDSTGITVMNGALVLDHNRSLNSTLGKYYSVLMAMICDDIGNGLVAEASATEPFDLFPQGS